MYFYPTAFDVAVDAWHWLGQEEMSALRAMTLDYFLIYTSQTPECITLLQPCNCKFGKIAKHKILVNMASI